MRLKDRKLRKMRLTTVTVRQPAYVVPLQFYPVVRRDGKDVIAQ